MPIKAKYNGSYKDITDLMNVDESIDYVLAKTSSSYKRVYTATRSIEDTPPTTFKSIKSDANLTDYRIYGQTSRNLFDMKTFAETCNQVYGTVNYINNTLTFTATNGVDAHVNSVYNKGARVYVGERPSCIDVLPSTTYTISMSSAPKCYISWLNSSYEVVSAYTQIPANQKSYTFTTPSNCTKLLIRLGKEVTNIGDTFTISDIMLNEGPTPLPYEPYGESVGDRTGNLFDGELIVNSDLNPNTGLPQHYNGRVGITTPLKITGGTYCLTFNSSRGNTYVMYSVLQNNTLVRRVTGVTSGDELDTSGGNELYIAFYRGANDLIPTDFSNIMLNSGSELLPYEPYGYRVPVSVTNGTDTVTTNLYLPEQIKMVGDEAEYVDFGEQKQHRVRKNLLQNTVTSQTINGVTFTVNDDGSVTCNTDENGATETSSLIISMTPDIPESTNLILSGCPEGGDISTYVLQYSNWVNSARNDTGSGISFTKYDYETYPTTRVAIRIYKGCVCNNLTFYPMIRLASIADDTYEPYITNTDLDVTLPALPTVTGTNVLSVGTEVQPSKIDITGHIKTISGGS